MSLVHKLSLWWYQSDWIPEILGGCRIAAARGSIKSANNKGDEGHPRWVSLFNNPLVTTEAVGDLYIFIQLPKWVLKPKMNKCGEEKWPLYRMLFRHLVTQLGKVVCFPACYYIKELDLLTFLYFPNGAYL